MTPRALADIPAWKRNLPLLALSILMLLCGAFLSIASLNLPLPATDHLEGPQHLLVIGFAVMSCSCGAGFLVLALAPQRAAVIFLPLLGIGIIAMTVTMSYSIYLYPLLHATP